MPNMHMRGRDRGKYNYYEHDDRGFSAGSSSERRVSFKNHGREGRRNHQAGFDQKQKIRNALLLDSDDVDMNTNSLRNFSITRIMPYSVNMRGRGGPRHPRDSPVPGFKRPPRVLHESVSNWYRVLVIKGNKHEKDYLIRVLQGHIRPHTFVPYGGDTKQNSNSWENDSVSKKYKVSGEDVTFFVDDHTVALELMNADRKIVVEGGQKVELKLNVKPNMAFVEIDDKLKEKMKIVMSRRYQAATFALNLRKFYADPEFIAEGVFIPINRPNVLSKIVQIICDSIPNLRALDLSENLLFNFDCLKPLADKLTQLKVLHMSNNKIKHLSQIESLKGLPLEDFNIDGNPVCDRYNDQSLYVREVRKRFPKVIKLDGIDLPPPIVFDVEDETSLMPVRGSFYCDINGRTMVLQFLEEYYKIFDSDSRQPLINAYHENAQFSLTCTPGLTSYIPDSRNLLIVQSLDKRVRLLRQGKSTIVSFFSSLIKTQHDPASFAIDVLLFNPQLIYVSVAGVYREPNSNKKLPIRAFSRVFVIVPVGSGFCIINDMFSVTNASPDQAKELMDLNSLMPYYIGLVYPVVPNREAFKLQVASAPPSTPVPVQPPPVMVSPVASTAVSPAPLGLDAGVKTQQEMVAALAMQSGMNFAWSEKCLNETNWNYENALYVFSELNKQGKVPPDAFVK